MHHDVNMNKNIWYYIFLCVDSIDWIVQIDIRFETFEQIY